MDANLNFLNPISSQPTSIGASSQSGGLDPNLAKPMSGQEFAGVMRDLMAKGERQELAGNASGTSPDAGVNALQTMALGNQFAVITTANPLPDSSSLAQFARAQGLSESAVQALFGDLAPTADAANLAQAGLPQMGLMGLPSNPTLSSNLVMPLGISSAAISAPSNTLTLLPSADSANTLTLLPSADSANTLTLLPSADTLSTAKGTINSNAVSNLLMATGATAVIQSLGDPGLKASNALGSAEQLAEETPELGPLDAMRMRMVPAWENMTRQLAKFNGTDQAAAWGQLTANLYSNRAAGGEAKEVLLDLGSNDPALNTLLDSLQDMGSQSPLTPLDSARNTASTGALGSAATSAALANPELTDRAAQIQDLADKLGKAMGERLQEQLERGEWKLQLKLNPAHLGKIDVELDMNLGGLDAVFKSDNSLTRELISQGMAKLRDSLAQSGMTVANVWVNSENQRQSGGNSTPRQQSGSDHSVNSPVNAVNEASAAESRIRDLRSSNAWDTLA
jgi:flagellar hook-length control protein FliK